LSDIESIIVGVDPGMKGGLAAYGWNSRRLIAYSRMPVWKIGPKTHVKARDVYDFLKTVDADVVVIEQVHAMPGQGVTSTFTFGQAFGAVAAAADIWPCPVEFVTPAVWKKQMQVTKDKRSALDTASRLWPGAVDWSVKANDGIAEAALIAKWYTIRNGVVPT
jgi:crossover junction endodeoxyribonuclease RuvC